MVIGIFTDTFYPEINGVATSVVLLKRELEKIGHTVHVFTSSNPAIKKGVDIENTNRLPSAPFIFLPNRRMAAVYKKSVAHKINSLNLDIIHTNTEFSLGMFGKLMAAVLNKPVIHTYHTLYEDYVHYITRGKFVNFSTEVARRFSKKFCNSCDSIVVPTEKTRDLLLNYHVERPISIIPTGIDLAQFQLNEADIKAVRALKAKYHIRNNDKVILYVGRLAKEKNLDAVVQQLPKYFKKNPNTKFLMVGDGPWKREIEILAKAGGILKNFIFTGEQPWSEIAKFYAMGDIFVSASLSETQGLTFIEAMASGLPVLAKRDRSIEKLILDGQTGCVFDDDNEIPQKLERILSDYSFRNRLSANARAVAADNSVDKFALNIEKAYEETIEKWVESGKRHKLNKKVIQRIIM